MLNAGFAAASLLALLTFAIHTFVGGIYVVRPLLAVQRLSGASRWLNYYCWHMTTLTLLVMAGIFAWSAVEPTARGFGILFTAMATAFSLLCVAVALKGGARPYRFPPTSLFAAVAAAGLWGAML